MKSATLIFLMIALLIIAGCGSSSEPEPLSLTEASRPATPAQRAQIIAVSNTFINALKNNNASLYCQAAYIRESEGSCLTAAKRTLAAINQGTPNTDDGLTNLQNQLKDAKIKVKGTEAKVIISPGNEQSMILIGGRWKVDVNPN